jgi:hypothetical protein
MVAPRVVRDFRFAVPPRNTDRGSLDTSGPLIQSGDRRLTISGEFGDRTVAVSLAPGAGLGRAPRATSQPTIRATWARLPFTGRQGCRQCATFPPGRSR